MRKAIRRTLVALWCLLSLGLLALWVRSRSHQDQFVYAPAGGRLWQLFCHRGEFGFSTATPWPNAERPQVLLESATPATLPRPILVAGAVGTGHDAELARPAGRIRGPVKSP